jgi:PST family polysaccharide transporter
MITGVITNKIIAVSLGPAGVALLGQYNNFFTMANMVASAGITSGITKYASEYRHDCKVHARIVGSTMYLSAIATLVTTLLISLTAVPVSKFLFNDITYVPYVMLTAILLVTGTFGSICSSLWNAHQEIKKLIIRNIIGTLISTALIPALVIPFGLKGAILASLFSSIILFVVFIPPLKTSPWFAWRILKPKSDKEFNTKLLKFSIMALTSMVMGYGVLFFIRRFIAESLSYTDAGIWQGMYKISEMYLSVASASLSIYFIPKLSSLKNSIELRKEIFSGYLILVPFTGICCFLIWILRKFIVIALFSPEFSPMESLFAYQVIGDFLKISAWLLSFLMVAKAMTRYYVLTEIIFGLLNVILHVIFIKLFGVKGAAIAYMFQYLIYAITISFLFRDILIPKKAIFSNIEC